MQNIWKYTCIHTYSNINEIGAVHILRQPPEGGEGVWQMLTIADKVGWGQKNVQKKKIMGTENVDKENN